MIRIPVSASASRAVDEAVGGPMGPLGVANRSLHGIEVSHVRLRVDDGLAVEVRQGQPAGGVATTSS